MNQVEWFSALQTKVQETNNLRLCQPGTIKIHPAETIYLTDQETAGKTLPDRKMGGEKALCRSEDGQEKALSDRKMDREKW